MLIVHRLLPLIRGCSRLHIVTGPTLFLVYINGLLCEIDERPKLGVQFCKNKMSSLLFTDDFVGIHVAETGSVLQILIDIVHNYSKHWRFEANVKKCTAVVFFINR